MRQGHIKTSLFILLIWMTVLSACKKYSYYQTNPNLPTVAVPSLMLTNICTDAKDATGNFIPGIFINNFSNNGDGSAFAARYLAFYGASGSDEITYGWTTGSFSNYDIIRNVNQMDTVASASGEQVYIGIGHFFRAVLFSQLTEMFGDVPYSAALKAGSGNITPVYDKQEDIYVGVLNELDQANTILAQAASAGTVILGDIIYNGSPSQWQKAVNAFRLRLLIHLSKKTADTKLNVVQQFNTIINNPSTYPLMSSIADNAQIVYNTTDPSNYYPTYGFIPVTTLMNIEQGIADTLITKQDPRLFAIAQPITGMDAGIFANYAGVNAGLVSSDQQNAAKTASLPADRYQYSETNEPTMLIGYPEQEFLIAEAITRGWITAGPGGITADSCYNTGIRASMQFYNTWASAGIADADISTYLAQPSVALSSSSATAITQILTQKYIAMFLQSDFEPFIEQRRTGIPTFDVGPGTLNGGLVPKRWMYPVVEYQQNGTNVKAAVQSQFGGTEDTNGVMWVLQ